MMNYLRILAMSLSFLLLLTYIFSLPVYANIPTYISISDAETMILYGLESMTREIPLGSFELNDKSLSLIFKKLKESYPGLYYVDSLYSFSYDKNGYILSLFPSYLMSAEEVRYSREQIEKVLKTFREQTATLSSEGDKALYTHDFLARNFIYSPSGDENYDIYSFLKTGHGVCQAFSLMFIMLGHAIGLEVDMVTSDAMDHAWNHVKIDGHYYNVDVTRDLSSDPDKKTEFTHDRFLLCDEALRQKGYEKYTCHSQHQCIQTNFQVTSNAGSTSGIFFNIIGSSLYSKHQWLAIDDMGSLCMLSLSGDFAWISYCIDLDGDGYLTLMDILDPAIQNAPATVQRITEALRTELLRQIAADYKEELSG